MRVFEVMRLLRSVATTDLRFTFQNAGRGRCLGVNRRLGGAVRRAPQSGKAVDGLTGSFCRA